MIMLCNPTGTKHPTYNTELPLAPARAQLQLSNKHDLVLYIDQELVEKSRELGFNLSKTLENHLKHLITQFSTFNPVNNFNSTDKNSDWWAGPGLSPNGFESISLHSMRKGENSNLS